MAELTWLEMEITLAWEAFRLMGLVNVGGGDGGGDEEGNGEEGNGFQLSTSPPNLEGFGFGAFFAMGAFFSMAFFGFFTLYHLYVSMLPINLSKSYVSLLLPGAAKFDAFLFLTRAFSSSESLSSTLPPISMSELANSIPPFGGCFFWSEIGGGIFSDSERTLVMFRWQNDKCAHQRHTRFSAYNFDTINSHHVLGLG